MNRWRGRTVLFGLLVGVAGVLVSAKPAAAADYSNTNMMDDGVFENVGAMTPGNGTPSVNALQSQIQLFFNGQAVTLSNNTSTTLSGGSTCLKNYQDVEPSFNGTSWSYGAPVPAARIIAEASVQWGINPEVIISTLQKEESLISGGTNICNNGYSYQSAMGYGCPDSGGCSSRYAGFTHQVLWGSWQLKFAEQRSYGNTAWDGDDGITYTGYMTQGDRARCGGCQEIFYDGFVVIDGVSTHMDNGTTAALYSYTPHLNQSFPGIFEGWFGSVRVPTFGWSLVGQYAYTDQTKTTGVGTNQLMPGQEIYVGVVALNTGNTTWTNNGSNPTRLGTWNPADRSSPFCDNWTLGCTRPAVLQQATVAPGQMGTFEFWMKTPGPGTYVEHFNMLDEWLSWFPDTGQNFTLIVQTPTYSWQSVGQFAYTDQTMATGMGTTGLLPDARVFIGFVAKNTGNLPWENSGPTAVEVATTGPPNRSSNFYDSSWLSSSRPATMQQASVAPGQMGTFGFWVQASTIGKYTERFTLVAGSVGAHNEAWMNDPGLGFSMTVDPPTYAWQPVGQFAYTDQNLTTGTGTTGLHAGDRVYIGFVARNTGNLPWASTGPGAVSVATANPIDRASPFYDSTWALSNRPSLMLTSSAAPGQMGTFGFWIKAPPQPGTYIEHFSLVAGSAAAGNQYVMNDPGLNFYITVQ